MTRIGSDNTDSKITKRVNAATRRQLMANEILNGNSRLADLASMFGVSASTICRDIQTIGREATKAAVHDVQTYRQQMRERLDDIYRLNYPGMVAGKPSSLNVGRRIVADLRKMYGLDEPLRIDTTLRHEDLIRSLAEQDGLDPDEAVAEVNRMMREQGFI